MVAQNTINDLRFAVSDLSRDFEPLDFTMSKFKSSTPTKHPLYRQYFGSNSDALTNHDVKEEQGKLDTFLKTIPNPTKRIASWLRDFLIAQFLFISLSVSFDSWIFPFILQQVR